MGADLYINSIYDPHYEKVRPQFDEACRVRNALDRTLQPTAYAEAQAEVDRLYQELDSTGYFRDSYNSSSLFWIIGLSWWSDVGDMLDDEGDLQPAKAQELLDIVKGREPRLKTYLADHDFSKDWSEPRAEIVAYFEDKYERFKAFLQQAIDLNEPIHCSI